MKKFKSVTIPEETFNQIKEVSKSLVNVPMSTAKAVHHITKEYLHEKNNNDPKDKRFKSDN